MRTGAVVAVIVWWLELQLPMQSVPITTDVVSSSPVRGALDTALCNKVCQRFAEGLVFSGQGTLDLEMK